MADKCIQFLKSSPQNTLETVNNKYNNETTK